MHSSFSSSFVSFLVGVTVFTAGCASLAHALEVPDFVLVTGQSLVKLKEFGKQKGVTNGRLDFDANNRCSLQLEGLLTLIGDCKFSSSNKKVSLTPDPESAEGAIFSFLEASVFKPGVRGAEPGKMKVRIKLKERNDDVIGKVRFKMHFIASLALAQDPSDPGPEVVRPLSFKYRYKGKTLLE